MRVLEHAAIEGLDTQCVRDRHRIEQCGDHPQQDRGETVLVFGGESGDEANVHEDLTRVTVCNVRSVRLCTLGVSSNGHKQGEVTRQVQRGLWPSPLTE